MKDALPERGDHLAGLEELEDVLAEDKPEALGSWKKEVEAWEIDASQPNPFEPKIETMTQASVRLQLAKEDAEALKAEEQTVLHNDVSGSVLITAGLDLEEQQRRLSIEKASLGVHATDRQEGTVLQKSISLQRRIDAWVKIQLLYMPSVGVVREGLNPTTDRPNKYPLCLPSAITGSTCNPTLLEYEWKLRFAQAHNALHSLRQALRCRSYLLKFKDRNLTGQGANTRARAAVKGITAKIDAASARYNAARTALTALAPTFKPSAWESLLQVLNPDDIRSMTDLLEGDTEGRRKFSWIWKVRGAAKDDSDRAGSLDAMRIEWCKARACAHRWQEEADWWDNRAKPENITASDKQTAESLVAYAKRQASLRRSLKARFQAKWKSMCTYLDSIDSGPMEDELVPPRAELHPDGAAMDVSTC
ncbi:hypothetical protein PAXINDRAFT_17230 [Paxillus involutus ATCC 200175]|uniref:Uncharacterized protein n=1 Tax=Paxillus involutus ATCC 200175 TaxID=664439 RepID=A0A0C9T1Y4_PAXIN|nr:hypothetical protein PAXINDRAFT_17230 [Paxillus involutus ATCC 200175]